MAVDLNLADIGSGFNRTPINNNFNAIVAAFQNTLSRDGTLPNQMEADIDFNSNDILNVGDINTQRIFVNGEQFVPGNVTAVGDRGWSPSFAIVTDSARRVLQLTGYVGGTGTPPTANIGKYVGATQMETLIANGVDIRGPQGASGAGSGDMLAAQNLNDVVSKPTAFANIKQNATETATGVVELATTVEAAAGTDTTRAVTAAGLTAFANAQPVSSEILLTSGTVTNAANLSIVLSSYTAYKHIRFVITGMRPAINNNTLVIRVSSDGGTNYDVGTFDYSYGQTVAYSFNQSGTTTTADTGMIIENNISNASPHTLDLDMTLHDWQSTTSYPKIIGNFIRSFASSGVPAQAMGTVGGYRSNLQLSNAIRFAFVSGNISTAKYSVYGIK